MHLRMVGLVRSRSVNYYHATSGIIACQVCCSVLIWKIRHASGFILEVRSVNLEASEDYFIPYVTVEACLPSLCIRP
jgi:cytosine/uracil/thiamine/allantoin permease